jgi:hypothetical protein
MRIRPRPTTTQCDDEVSWMTDTYRDVIDTWCAR